MRLKTYPRLNLPSKRLGIQVDDWIWVGLAMIPGLFVQSIVFSIACALAVGLWCAFIKPRKPRGWFSAFLEFKFSQTFGLSKPVYRAQLKKEDFSQ